MALPGAQIATGIAASGLTIYDELVDRPELVYAIDVLESRLDEGLRGLALDYPLRRRAKIAKEAVATLLGYPVPRAFRKTRPRFPGQNFDVFVQKSDNLQIWNEEIDPARRYVIIRVGESEAVTAVRVLTGEAVALLDRTGTLTSKYQAKRRPIRGGSLLVAAIDTQRLRDVFAPTDYVGAEILAATSPIARPKRDAVLSIASIYERLLQLVGRTVIDPGLLQDRNRGVALQRMICEALGLGPYADAGKFPDVLSQALEVKLQMSPTIDLGLVTPDSAEPAAELGVDVRHCDVRYAVVYGEQISAEAILISEIVVTTGEAFFSEFQRFEGLIQNKKRQLPLPRELFATKRAPD